MSPFKVSWPNKFPNQIGTFGADLVNHLASNETIVSVEASVLVGDVTLEGESFSGSVITTKVSAGTSGVQKVLMRAVTNLGNEPEVLCEFEVVAYPTA